MTEFHVEVIKVGPIERHPNADALSITQVHGGYPVILRTGDFQEGDLATYIPVDALVPVDRPEFSFLGASGMARIRAKKLRGTFSMGLLIPAPAHTSEGDDVQALLGVEKWEPGGVHGNHGGVSDGFEIPGPFPVPKYDLEALRRHTGAIAVGEEVVITEKIHGCNARFVFYEGRLHVGSRTRWLKEDPSLLWWKLARRLGLEDMLAKIAGVVIFGEAYGQVQDLKYGREDTDLRIFDVWTPAHGFHSFGDAEALTNHYGLSLVPVLHRGPWDPALMSLAEGKSQLADHVREGIVVRTAVERVDPRIGRMAFKLHGQGYLLRKDG